MNSIIKPKLNKDQLLVAVIGVLTDDIHKLQKEIRELRGQNKGLIITNSLLRERPDLPVDRLPVMREVKIMRKLILSLEAEIDELRNQIK